MHTQALYTKILLVGGGGEVGDNNDISSTSFKNI